jgi:hypothetical protein
VRTFVRHDKGYGNRKRRPVILRAAEEITSDRLSAVLREEFVALGLPVDALSDALSEGVSDTPDEGGEREEKDALEALGQKVDVKSDSPVDDGLFSQVYRLSDRASGSASDRTTRSEGVVGCLVSSSFPHPSTLIPAGSGGAASGDPKTKPKAKRAHRLPPSWKPNEAHRTRAVQEGLDPRQAGRAVPAERRHQRAHREELERRFHHVARQGAPVRPESARPRCGEHRHLRPRHRDRMAARRVERRSGQPDREAHGLAVRPPGSAG